MTIIKYEKEGCIYWFKDDQLHREDGPALIIPNSYEVWYKNGFVHREDGPAYEDKHGKKEWWIEGVKLSEKEFDDYVFKKFLRDSLESDLQTGEAKKQQKI